MKKLLLLATACLLAAGAVHAADTAPSSRLYGELGYTTLDIKAPGLKFKPSVLRGIVGYDVDRNVALEAMLAVGARASTESVMGVDVEAKVTRSFGLFVKPKAMLGDSVEVFGRVGFVDSRLAVNAPGLSLTESDSSLAYGLGLNWLVSKDVHLGLDWARYYKKDETTIDGLSLNVGMRF